MAGTTGSKCPVCGKSVGVGLVSGTLIQHENKNGERCRGTGMAPVVAAPRSSGSASGSASTSRPRASAGGAAAGRYKPSTGTSVSGAAPAAGGDASGARGSAAAGARQTAPARRGVTVRKVEVDQEWLKAREEKQERLRLERDARARARNEIYSTGIGEEAESAPTDGAPAVDGAAPTDPATGATPAEATDAAPTAPDAEPEEFIEGPAAKS